MSEPRLHNVAFTASQLNLLLDILEERGEQFKDHPDAFTDGYYEPGHVERCHELYDLLAEQVPPILHAEPVEPLDPGAAFTFVTAWAGPLECTPAQAVHIAGQQRRLIKHGGVLVRMPVVEADAYEYQLQRGDRVVSCYVVTLRQMATSPCVETARTDVYVRMLDRFVDDILAALKR